ncbi:MAG: hypothetical protein U0103_00545 [Candidatus Obscuribacterales bacterium]|nr:hypothetical protein [Cyanobacteria bacterium SZAS LIN-5]RTL42628.1 MAG: hypothetical protein EKK48_11620 [Candidatus Melainabacteria bacterium]
MTNAITIIERLLGESSVQSNEHVIETASRHVSNVERRFSESFDLLVKEITNVWGKPQFNSTVPGMDDPVEEEEEEEESAEEQSTTQGGDAVRKKKKLRNVVPPWSNGKSKTPGCTCKALRLAYWRRTTMVAYVVLRAEFDKEKNVAITYDLCLGARRRGQEQSKSFQQLKHTNKGWFRPFINWLFGKT